MSMHRHSARLMAGLPGTAYRKPWNAGLRRSGWQLDDLGTSTLRLAPPAGLFQGPAEGETGPGEPAHDRADRQAQYFCRLPIGDTLYRHQQQDRALVRREAGDRPAHLFSLRGG
jgi:putative hemolysin